MAEVVELEPEAEGLDQRSADAHAIDIPAAPALLRRATPGLATADLRLLGVTASQVTLGEHLSPATGRRRWWLSIPRLTTSTAGPPPKFLA